MFLLSITTEMTFHISENWLFTSGLDWCQ